MEFFNWFWDVLAKPQISSIFLACGVAVAVRSISMSRLIAKQKETVQLLFDARNDEQLAGGLSLLEALHDNLNDNVRSYGKEKKSDPQAAQIRYVLNHWERIAVAVQAGTYCEKIIKKAACSTFLSLHMQATPMILAIREATGKKTYYQEIDWLAARWNKAPLKVKS